MAGLIKSLNITDAILSGFTVWECIIIMIISSIQCIVVAIVVLYTRRQIA